MNQPRNDPGKLAELVASFPTLTDAPPIGDLQAFDAWAAGSDCTGMAYFAATFILSVARPGLEWSSGRFDAVTALMLWDTAHRCAFLTWAASPWGGV